MDGGVSGTIGVAIDVTDRVRLDEELRQTQKMEAIGRLAGGIAHDFNNLLTAITGYAEIALEANRPAEDARADLEEILKASQMASALTRQLPAFSRRQVLHVAAIDLLLTDVVMPGMSGLELARTLQAERRSLRVLFTSGYTNHTVAESGESGADAEFIQKPFSPRALLEKVRLVLDARHQERPLEL